MIAFALAITVIAAALVAYSVPVGVWTRIFPSVFSWLPMVCGLISFVGLQWYYNSQSLVPIQASYFEISAQVMPVLLLTAVIETRSSKNLRTHQLAFPVIMVALGENTALRQLAFPIHGAKTYSIVGSSMVVAFVALLLAVLADLNDRREGGLDVGAREVNAQQASNGDSTR
jgi:hypothetical protein